MVLRSEPDLALAAVSAEQAGLAGLEALSREWSELRAAAGQPLFADPAWVRAQVVAFENPARLRLLTTRDQGRLTAVLALLEERVWFRGLPMRRLRAAAGVHSLRFDPVAADDRAASALASALLQRDGWDMIELRDVAPGGAVDFLLEQAHQRGFPIGTWESMQSPYLDLSAPPPSLTSGGPGALPQKNEPPLALSRAFRTELRRSRRRLLAAAGLGEPHDLPPDGDPLRLERLPVASPAALQRALDRFYALERRGWKGRRGTAIACRPAVQDFYDQAGSAMAARGWLRIDSLELRGHPLAMCYGLCDGSRYDVIKWAYEEAYAPYGPGHLLIEAIVRDCLDHGIRRLSINGPDAAYKRKWTRSRQQLEFVYIFQPSLLGRLAHQLKFVWTPRLQTLLQRRRP